MTQTQPGSAQSGPQSGYNVNAQCPRCASFRSTQTMLYRDPATGQPLGGSVIPSVFGALLVIVVAFLLVWLMARGGGNAGGWGLVMIVVALGLAVGTFVVMENRRSARERAATQVRRHLCSDCGKIWETQTP